jgi:large subunit ribosomal protein L31
MKKNIHPEYNHNLEVICSCGNKFVTGSTIMTDSINVDICSKCHPFYTGEQKIVDTDNIVKKFEDKLAKSNKMSYRTKKEKMLARKEKLSKVSSRPSTTLTLKDLLENAKVSK